MRNLTILVFLFFLGFSSLQAQLNLSKGTFSMEGGNYILDAELKGGKLIVIEPNRTTPYTLLAGNKYQYYHDEFQKTYYVEIIDANTLHFTSSNTPDTTVLKRMSAESIVTSWDKYDRYMEIAEKYQALAENKSDSDLEVQAYTFCAASALNGAMKTEKEYHEYALQAASALKLILVNPNKNPCSDAIPDLVWKKATL